MFPFSSRNILNDPIDEMTLEEYEIFTRGGIKKIPEIYVKPSKFSNMTIEEYLRHTGDILGPSVDSEQEAMFENNTSPTVDEELHELLGSNEEILELKNQYGTMTEDELRAIFELDVDEYPPSIREVHELKGDNKIVTKSEDGESFGREVKMTEDEWLEILEYNMAKYPISPQEDSQLEEDDQMVTIKERGVTELPREVDYSCFSCTTNLSIFDCLQEKVNPFSLLEGHVSSTKRGIPALYTKNDKFLAPPVLLYNTSCDAYRYFHPNLMFDGSNSTLISDK